MKRVTVSTTVLACLLTALFAVGTFAGELVFFSPIVGSNPGVPSVAWRVAAPRGWFAMAPQFLRWWSHSRGCPRAASREHRHHRPGYTSCGKRRVLGRGSRHQPVVNLSAQGNAEISDRLTLPSPCFGPVVLIRVTGVNNTPTAAPGPWIAITGTLKDAKDNDANDNDNDDHGHDSNDR